MVKPNQVDTNEFSLTLYTKLQEICPAIGDMELYEFRYALEALTPSSGWDSVLPLPMEEIEKQVNDIAFYESIQLKPYHGKRMVMDEKILNLSRMLACGMVWEIYPSEWINQHFYFDIRGFYFLHRTVYFTPEITAYLGGKPWRKFPDHRQVFHHVQSIGYKAFQAANVKVDQCFMDTIEKLIERKGLPVLIAIAGQTAAGKTEIVSRLYDKFESSGKRVTSIEMDNFFTDRDYREEHGIDSRGMEALHYDLFKQALTDICSGKQVIIPRYDFVSATSSHDLDGKLKPGRSPLTIEPADVIFMEGNFPFLLPEIAYLIDIKVVYLTDDDIRLKRKWKRDMDYRKKYDLMYFLNRYFREQFIMAEEIYRPQMMLCDMVVDTTNAAIWLTPEILQVLEK